MHIQETPTCFELAFEYNREIKNKIKKIPGSKWHPLRTIWTVPLNARHQVEKIREAFGSMVTTALPEQFAAIEPLPELTVEIPLARKLFPYQANGVAYSLDKKRVIMGDDMGLGKTTQAIATAVAAGAWPVLVVCPASVKLNWQREWLIVAGIKSMILTDSVKGTWPTWYKTGHCQVFITNYESLPKFFVTEIRKSKEEPLLLKHIFYSAASQLFKMIIWDEIHRCKEESSRVSKIAIGLSRNKEYVLGLTGTPVVNKPKDLVTQLKIIEALHLFGTRKQFIDRYCDGKANGSSNLRELNYIMSKHCFYRRMKKEVLHDLPDKMRQIVLCDITTRKEYDKCINDIANYLREYKEATDEKVRQAMQGEAFLMIGACKNISARGKMNEGCEYIDEVVEAGEKVVVFCHLQEITTELMRRYPKAVTVRGADSAESRQRAVDKFQTDPNCHVIICSMKAAGVGITLTASSRVLFFELPWHAADADQCEDRCYRIGQKNSVSCTYLLGKDTIDEDIYQIIEKKRAIAGEVTGTQDNTQKQVFDKLSSLFNKDKVKV